MAKLKIDIGAKEFTKLLEGSTHLPNKEIIKSIDSKMFALDNNKVLNYQPHKLAHEEFTSCLSLFESRNKGLDPSQIYKRLMGVMNLITRLEKPHIKELEALAINIIKEIYDVPDYVNLSAMINPSVSLNTSQNKSPQPFLNLTLEQKNAMRDEIQKRVAVNALVHGSSMQVWKGVYHLVSAEIKKINPDLVELYDMYTSLIGLQLWLVPPSEAAKAIEQQQQMTQGFNKLTFNKEQGFGGDIQAEALNFPVLLHELNKGVVDWIASAGIPSQYNEEELRYYYSKADDYQLEHWHYLLGPGLWNKLLSAKKISNEEIPQLFSDLVKLSPTEFVEELRKIQDQ
jgi:hypothetical protein